MRRSTLFESATTPLDDWRGRRVTVMGLGLFGGGRGVTEFFAARGARVTVTDLRDEETLGPSLAALRHLDVRWVLGEHRLEHFTTDADLVVVSPAVPRSAELVQAARRHGLALETETNLFFKYCPARITGVTGSNGKTTTTTLLTEMLRAIGRRVHLGGNVGRSLLPQLAEIQPSDEVVLELSSFQLEDLACIARRPAVSVLTNLSPNHLDRHGTFEAYVDAKLEILRGDADREAHSLPGVAVLNADDAVTRERWSSADRALQTERRVSWVGSATSLESLARAGETLQFFEVDGVAGRVRQLAESNGIARTVLEPGDLRLPGAFNLQNAAQAVAATLALLPGRDASTVDHLRSAARAFRGVAHRLELVDTIDGIEYWNDSIATTPESTIAALEALGPDVVLLSGGASKGCAFDELARAIAEHARGVVLYGKTASAIAASLESVGAKLETCREADLEHAVARARSLARPGDRVILSPACPSYDQFVHFQERGDRFRELAALQSGRAVR